MHIYNLRWLAKLNFDPEVWVLREIRFEFWIEYPVEVNQEIFLGPLNIALLWNNPHHNHEGWIWVSRVETVWKVFIWAAWSRVCMGASKVGLCLINAK